MKDLILHFIELIFRIFIINMCKVYKLEKNI